MGLLLGVAQRRNPAGDDRDFMHRVGMFDRLGHDCVSGFMESDNFLLLGTHHPVLLLKTRHHPVDGLVEIRQLNRFLIVAGGQQRGFIDDIGQVGPHKPGRAAGDQTQVDFGAQDHIPGCEFSRWLPVR